MMVESNLFVYPIKKLKGMRLTYEIEKAVKRNPH